MLLVVMLSPLSLAMEDGEFDNGGGSGSVGGPAAVAVVAAAAVGGLDNEDGVQ
jgi:hypothetical protein